ncbi:MAG TPA: phytanoyl-CoA dioxygenase family protein [Hyphomicrobiaceae bacterium]|jgi:hypothetical protein|nr:phytanoyl-CoA dioxygenase family protein [Hyphomicrobiaceae bacterium]
MPDARARGVPVLSEGQVSSLRRNGYVHVPSGVPRDLVDGALRAINQCLGRGLDPARLETYRSRSFCPELQKSREVTDLLYGGAAWGIAESLLGQQRIKRPGTGQIALSFPTSGSPVAPHPHLDGMYTPANGVPRGKILSFTMLVGVMLSDVEAAGSGNLLVWPGTHHLYQDYFRRQGPRSLLEGMPDVALPPSVPVTGRAGDLVLCHYQLAHAAGPNTSPHVRYAVYFRLEHVDHRRQRWECLTDVWREWPGLREASR